MTDGEELFRSRKLGAHLPPLLAATSQEKLTPAITGWRLILHDRPRHKRPGRSRDTAWDKRYTALFRFVAEQGRFPKQLGGPVEHGIQRGLYNQRVNRKAAKLDQWQEELLEVLGDWR